MIENVTEKLKYLDPISLDELSDYKLLNRIDTKYLCNESVLPSILEQAQKDFRVQTIGKKRIFKYESLYFDTPERKTYLDHHQGKRIRYKIRFRNYLDTGDTFLEIKKKRSYTRTDKKRNEFKFSPDLGEPHYDFIRKYIDLPGETLTSTLWTVFDRITLAGRNHLERVTIDTGIRFRDRDHEILMPGLAIIEVKREKKGFASPFTHILKEQSLKPYGISKYILGNILLVPGLKHNRFLRKVTTVNKICYGT